MHQAVEGDGFSVAQGEIPFIAGPGITLPPIARESPGAGFPEDFSLHLFFLGAKQPCGLSIVQSHIGAQWRTEAAQRRKFGTMDFRQIGVAFENFTKAIFNKYREPEVGTEAFQNVERGCGKDAIAQAPQPEDGDPATPRQTF